MKKIFMTLICLALFVSCGNKVEKLDKDIVEKLNTPIEIKEEEISFDNENKYSLERDYGNKKLYVYDKQKKKVVNNGEYYVRENMFVYKIKTKKDGIVSDITVYKVPRQKNGQYIPIIVYKFNDDGKTGYEYDKGTGYFDDLEVKFEKRKKLRDAIYVREIEDYFHNRYKGNRFVYCKPYDYAKIFENEFNEYDMVTSTIRFNKDGTKDIEIKEIENGIKITEFKNDKIEDEYIIRN